MIEFAVCSVQEQEVQEHSFLLRLSTLHLPRIGSIQNHRENSFALLIAPSTEPSGISPFNG